MSILYNDPVCGAPLTDHNIEVVHSGISCFFCSNQCRERFLANPHLYIGYPGHQAPKQRGVQALRRRHFKLEQALTPQQADIFINYLKMVVGVKLVDIDGLLLDIQIIYDLMIVTAEQIEDRLHGIGLSLGSEWPERLRRGFINFIEELEVSGLDEPPYLI